MGNFCGNGDEIGVPLQDFFNYLCKYEKNFFFLGGALSVRYTEGS